MKRLNPEVQGLPKGADFSQSAPYLFGQGIEHKIMDAVCMLKRTTTAEFKPRNFFKGAPLNQVGQGGAGTRHKPAINPTTQTKEVLVQEGPSQEQPPRSRTIINLIKPQKSDITHKCITCCKFFNKLSFPALQWVQVNLVLNYPLEDSSSTGRLYTTVSK